MEGSRGGLVLFGGPVGIQRTPWGSRKELVFLPVEVSQSTLLCLKFRGGGWGEAPGGVFSRGGAFEPAAFALPRRRFWLCCGYLPG